jgi:hypothetical protein
MAFETGTAAHALELFNKLQGFIKTHADLVSAGENWITVWQDNDSTDVVLRGPGLAAQDQVYVGMRLFVHAPSDRQWIELYGMSGITPTAQNLGEHVNVGPGVRMLLDSNPMEYWFVANGRRFIVVLKISTVFEACYAGFYLPYATPLSYGYPMFIGGSASVYTPGYQNGEVPADWRSIQHGHRHFTLPTYNTGFFHMASQAVMMDPAAQWLSGGNGSANGILSDGQFTVAPEFTGRDTFGAVIGQSGFKWEPHALFPRIGSAFGGDFVLTPITLCSTFPADQQWGILDGCFRCQGFNNASENLINYDGVDHLVVQNVFRTGLGDYWALALE